MLSSPQLQRGWKLPGEWKLRYVSDICIVLATAKSLTLARQLELVSLMIRILKASGNMAGASRIRVLSWNVNGLKPVLLRRSESLVSMLDSLNAGRSL